MARPENPIPESSPLPLRNFADKMRSCRTAKGISYRDMAKLANYSASALSQAASGKELPSWELTRAYIRACDPFFPVLMTSFFAISGTGTPPGKAQGKKK
ncbi:helix-turn-helix domain-containing protein [Streptomyces sp. NPDC053069]|uniref:helix-turn-helix domain-containing protein n=1 Tax=Streptomyces sp. NPDC053069 TaxID=3365695 RepID=UPI0037D48D07